MGKSHSPSLTTARAIRCYHCRSPFEVSARAMTVGCPECGKQLLVDDIVVKSSQLVRKLQTCGRIIVQARGRVVADLVEAHEGIECRGLVQTKGYLGGPVLIGAKGTWIGDCSTPSLAVEAGAKIENGLFVVGEEKGTEVMAE